MNSFEENIKKQQLLQKSFAETFTGQNEVFKIVEALKKAGVPEDEMIEKAKYIRREGTKGNYKYIYEESKDGNSKPEIKMIMTDEFYQKLGEEELKNHLDFLKKQRGQFNKKSSVGMYNKYDKKVKLVENLLGNKDSTQNKEDKKLSIDNIYEAFRDKFGNNETLEIRKPEKDNYSGYTKFFVRREEYVSGLGRRAMNVYGIESRKGKFNIIYDGAHYDLDVTSVEEAVNKLADKMKLQKSQSSDLQKAEQTEAQKAKIAKVIREFKEGTLKSSSGEKVTSKEQALAIAMSEAGLSTNKSVISNIYKAHINRFAYDSDFKISKTGKELKDRLIDIHKDELRELSEYKKEMLELINKIGSQPDCEMHYYIIDGFEYKIIDIPKLYNKSTLVDSSGYTEPSETDKLKNRYDEKARQYVECQKEIQYIKTMLDNFKDSEKYNMTVAQATMLGF